MTSDELYRLKALRDASAELLKSALRGRDIAFRSVAETVRKVLFAEHCSVFDVPSDDSSGPSRFVLRLMGEYPTPNDKSHGHDRLMLPIHCEEGRGLLGWIAYNNELYRALEKDLRSNSYTTVHPPTHVNSHHCTSLLAVPLHDRKQNILGILKVENKLRDSASLDRPITKADHDPDGFSERDYSFCANSGPRTSIHFGKPSVRFSLPRSD